MYWDSGRESAVGRDGMVSAMQGSVRAYGSRWKRDGYWLKLSKGVEYAVWGRDWDGASWARLMCVRMGMSARIYQRCVCDSTASERHLGKPKLDRSQI